MLNFLVLLAAALAPVMATFPTTTVYQSTTGFFLENIAVRPSGKLLLTSVLSGTLHTLDPKAANATLDDVYAFPEANALTGIVEYRPDVYAVVASNLSFATRRAAPGTVIALWKVDFTKKTPAATRIVGLPKSALINGLSVVPGNPDLVLAADCDAGAAYEINMRTGVARIAVQDEALTPPAPPPALGINGLHVHDGALYFANSGRGTFGRVPLSLLGGRVNWAGPVQILTNVTPAASETTYYDDFAIDHKGRAWMTQHPAALTLISPLKNGTWSQVTAAGDAAGNYTTLIEPTSAVFGREGCEKTLYVTTGGGQIISVDTEGV